MRKSGGAAEHNRNNRQPHQRGQHPTHLFREDGQQNAQETINSHLRHRAGQQHRHGRRRFRVGQRQPGVERHQRHFDGEAEQCHEEDNEGQAFLCGKRIIPAEFDRKRGSQFAAPAQFAQTDEVECFDRLIDGQERQQQRHAANHGINEELRGGGAALRPAPEFDEKESRNQAQFPENEPVKEVQRGKRAEQPRLQEENQRVIQWRAVTRTRITLTRPLATLSPSDGERAGVRGVPKHFPRRQHGHRHDNRRQQDHQQAEAIDADEVFNAKRGDPQVALDELQLRRCRIKVLPDKNCETERDQTEREREAAREVPSSRADADDDAPANQRNECQRCQPRKVGHAPPPASG